MYTRGGARKGFYIYGYVFAPRRSAPLNRCVYVDGYFVVEGEASFVRCENGGGGESSPGPGGVMYVGPAGSVLFADTVYMAEVSIIDDEGNNGGGIYNEGKVRN